MSNKIHSINQSINLCNMFRKNPVCTSAAAPSTVLEVVLSSCSVVPPAQEAPLHHPPVVRARNTLRLSVLLDLPTGVPGSVSWSWSSRARPALQLRRSPQTGLRAVHGSFGCKAFNRLMSSSLLCSFGL